MHPTASAHARCSAPFFGSIPSLPALPLGSIGKLLYRLKKPNTIPILFHIQRTAKAERCRRSEVAAPEESGGDGGPGGTMDTYAHDSTSGARPWESCSTSRRQKTQIRLPAAVAAEVGHGGAPAGSRRAAPVQRVCACMVPACSCSHELAGYDIRVHQLNEFSFPIEKKSSFSLMNQRLL